MADPNTDAEMGPASSKRPTMGLMMPEQEDDGGGEQPNVTPEEQKQYDEFVENALRLTYDKKTMPNVLETLKGGDNPIEGLANTLVMVVTALEKQADAAGAELSSDVIFHGSFEIIADLANLQKEAGIADLDDDEVEKAIYMAIDIYRQQKQSAGRLDVEGISQDMDELMAAEKEGRLDEIAPGATEAAKRMQDRGWTQQGGDQPPAAPQQA